MFKELEQVSELVPAGPLRLCVLVVFIVVIATPHIRRFWLEFRHRKVELELVRAKLEIFKLAQEVHLLSSKEGALPTPDSLSAQVTMVVGKSLSSKSNEIHKTLPFRDRYMAAASGSLLSKIIFYSWFVASSDRGPSLIAILAFLCLAESALAAALSKRSLARALFAGILLGLIL